MAQKRAARRGRKAVAGSDVSVELGHNGEYPPAKKPTPEGVEASQSDNEETAVRALAAARDVPSASPRPAGGGMSSKYSTSRRQEEEVEEEEKVGEEESTEAPGPNPQLKRKRASAGRVTRSQQRKVSPAPAQPSESKKKPNLKKNTPAPLRQQLSEPEMPKSKKITPAPPLRQQGEERAQPSKSEMPKSKRIRRVWTPSDEVRILKALIKHRRKQGKLPAPENNHFFDSVAKRLEDRSFNRFHVKDKVRSLMRRYKSYVLPTTDHEKRLDDLSKIVWGDLPATRAANGNNVDGEQDEAEHAIAEDDENGGGQTLDKSFEEMCEMYPLLGQEVKRFAGIQSALRSSFTGLDGKRALLMENKLGKLKWKELKIQAEMDAKVEAPKARIRKELVNFLSKVSTKGKD